MLSPNTAQPGRSVWNQVHRDAFENRLDSLQRTNLVPEPRVLREEDWPKPSRLDVLPFEIEKQLSDDIAFISAYEYGVPYVTAAAIEVSEPNVLLVRLAANEGVCAIVVDALKRLFSTLERCAEKALPQKQCVEDTLDIVVHLNRNRILGRLASGHFRRPQHETGPARAALSDRLKAYMKSSKRQSAITEEFHRQVEAFHTAFLDVENYGPNTARLKRVVTEAFRLTVDGISLSSRLHMSGFSPSTTDTRVIREINKVANYWRICQSLAHLSRSYRTLFSKMKLESIEPFAPSVRHGSSTKRYVHAEIQLLVYYERRGLINRPRILGVSKEACFLCDSFIKAHGLFCVSKAHRQIYSHWTIPDLADYSAEALDRLQRTLATVHRDVEEALNQARCNRSFRQAPHQSSINLHHPRLPTPSVTTIRSVSLERTDIASEIVSPSRPHLSTVLPESELLGFSQLDIHHHSSASTASTSSTLKGSGETASKEITTDTSEDPSILVEPNFPGRTFPRCLDLYASLERSTSNRSHTRTFLRASVNLGYPHDSIVKEGRITHCLDLTTLAVGEEIVLPNPIDPNEDVSSDTEMNVILTYPRMDPVMLSCLWHGQDQTSP